MGSPQVLRGIEAALAAGLRPVKVNTVVQRGRNDHTVLDLLEHFRGTDVTVRLIEYMDVGNRNDWEPGEVVPSAELLRQDPHALARDAGAGPLPRRSGRALRLRRRRRRDRLRLLGQRAVLRRLQSRPPVVRGRALHVPVRDAAASTCARRCVPGRPTRNCSTCCATRGRSARTATASCAAKCARAKQPLRKVEMHYIGG